VKDGEQKLGTLTREVGCKHEERSNANLLKTLLVSSHGSNQDHWCEIFGQLPAVKYGGIPEFLGRLKARGHALMAKWGQDILLEKNGKQKDLSALSSLMQWQWQRLLELCQRWQPQTSATGNVISWNLGPLDIHAAQPYIAQTMRKKVAIVMLQEIRIH